MGNFLEPDSRSPELIDASNCFIMIIDVQSIFMQGLTEGEQTTFLRKYTHLIKLSQVLEIPFIMTAEDIEKNGSIPKNLQDILLKNTKIYDKLIFSCWGQKDIQMAIRDTKRQVAVLCGFETDVCIAQTAIDLQRNGFQVIVLVDMTFSRNLIEHETGLRRMEHHGIILSLLKTWQFELSAGVRTAISQILKENNLDNI